MISLRNTFLTAYKTKPYPNYWDVIALIFVLSGLSVLAWNAKQMAAPYYVGQALPISLDPAYLPGYALRTVLRMLIALIFSLLFTFTVATWAAKSRRAERIIIPLIDILQSVPILGFLSIAVVGFIQLFPNSMLGPECAVIFVIFTSQAWNMALGFYQTVRSVPKDLEEAAEMLHLSAWQRFWRIDVPFSLPGLLWNAMMSMSAGWFFVVVSEAISVNHQQILLPGIGSYITVAIQSADLKAIGYAILTMFIVILIYDQLLFRPSVAWAEKFKFEQLASENEVSSWVVNLLHRTRFLRYLGIKITYLFDAFVNVAILRSVSDAHTYVRRKIKRERLIVWSWNILLITAFSLVCTFLVSYVWQHVAWPSLVEVFLLGIVTALRIFILIIVCSLVWVPIGVWVGLRPRLAPIVQPLAQFLAAFPANLLYPLFVIMIFKYHLNKEVWLTPLMILGAQWYLVFNVIAGASQLPKDLLQVADNFGLSRWLRWRRLILPGIFPYYITGAITAVGGAWNASIVAEVASWGDKKLVATGLGSYISEYTESGDFFHVALGIGMMCAFVLLLNYFVWRPLYNLAVSRYQLD